MVRIKRRAVMLSLGVILIFACAPVLAPADIPTTDPKALNTVIAQTANASFSQTAAALPPTFTPTSTPLPPTGTPTETPPPTPTFIFLLASPTSSRTATPLFPLAGGGSYDCKVISQSPEDGTVFSPNADFDARWQVRNTGTSVWDSNSADYRYIGGAKLHQAAAYDLPESVSPGDTVDLVVDMRAPKDPDEYTTTWRIRIGKSEFCNMRLTITVEK